MTISPAHRNGDFILGSANLDNKSAEDAAERTGIRHHRPLSPMPCGPTAGPKGSGAELGSLQLTGSSAFTCRNTGPWSFVGGEACTPKLPADERWERAASAVMPLLQEVPQHVMMITVPAIVAT